MPYVVAESCIQCKCTDCVAICPTDCFRAGPNFLVIDPDEYIGYSICVPECPVDAIYPAAKAPADQQDFIALNTRLPRHADWPCLTKVRAPLQDHAYWAQVKDERDALIIAPD